MKSQDQSDIIIIGGSYAGLSAAMSLGRARRRVLILDAGEPCNRQTPHSHNFITQDGETPFEIATKAKEQVLAYKTVSFVNAKVTRTRKTENGFEVNTEQGDGFYAKKIILATGIKDLFTGIKGLKDCWGISVLHCPYCHGYEVHGEKLGVIINGDMAYHFVQMISHWSDKVVLLTNGKSTLSQEQTRKIESHGIDIIETEIDEIEHEQGKMDAVVFKDQSKLALSAVFTRLPFEHHTDLHQQLGCELTETGHIRIDGLQRTTVAGVYAAGDNCNPARSLATSVGGGSMAGAMLNREMIEDSF